MKVPGKSGWSGTDFNQKLKRWEKRIWDNTTRWARKGGHERARENVERTLVFSLMSDKRPLGEFFFAFFCPAQSAEPKVNYMRCPQLLQIVLLCSLCCCCCCVLCVVVVVCVVCCCVVCCVLWCFV